MREMCPYLELLWSVFSRIWPEYGKLRSRIFEYRLFSRIDIEFDTYNLIKILLQLDLVQLARFWEILDALKGRLHETGLWRKSQSVEGPKYLLLKI